MILWWKGSWHLGQRHVVVELRFPTGAAEDSNGAEGIHVQTELFLLPG